MQRHAGTRLTRSGDIFSFFPQWTLSFPCSWWHYFFFFYIEITLFSSIIHFNVWQWSGDCRSRIKTKTSARCRPRPPFSLLSPSQRVTGPCNRASVFRRRLQNSEEKYSAFGWKWHQPIKNLTQLVIWVCANINKRSHYQIIIAQGSKQKACGVLTLAQVFFSKNAKVAFLLFKGQRLNDNGAPLSVSSAGAPQPCSRLKGVW